MSLSPVIFVVYAIAYFIVALVFYGIARASWSQGKELWSHVFFGFLWPLVVLVFIILSTTTFLINTFGQDQEER